MVFLDVEQDGDFGAQVMKAAVEFARLGDEEIALPRAAARIAKLRNGAADDEARIAAAFVQGVSDHRGGRAFPMRACDRDAIPFGHHLSEQLGVLDRLHAVFLSGFEFKIRIGNGRRADDELRFAG